MQTKPAMTCGLLVVLLICAVVATPAAARQRSFQRLYADEFAGRAVRFMSLNTCFLFDQVDDPDTAEDQDFEPADYDAKIKAVADVIAANAPDAVGLQEVENRQVLTDLVARLPRTYEILHFESLDRFTGQDVALLYDPARVQPTGDLRTNLELGTGLGRISKGILEQAFEVVATGERLVVLVTHLKSQRGGTYADLQRMAQARTVRGRLDALTAAGESRVVLMGDLNDGPGSDTLDIIRGRSDVFVDSLASLPDDESYSYRSAGFGDGSRVYLHRMDYILLSPTLAGGLHEGYVDNEYLASPHRPTDHGAVVLDYVAGAPAH